MKPSIFILSCMCFLNVSAQVKNSFYALDSKMNQTELDSSKYILWIHESGDKNWQWDYYYTWGPLVKSNSFADHDGTVPNGPFYLYTVSGMLDSMGYYDHGKKNGSFYKLKKIKNDSLVFAKQYNYKNDSLLDYIDLEAEEKKSKLTDSSHETESEYPGGGPAWQNYLSKNLKYPERAYNKEVQGSVRVCFIVDLQGKVIDPFIQKSVEYSLDQESISIIQKSGDWLPGKKDGVPVKTFKVQPLNFRLESN